LTSALREAADVLDFPNKGTIVVVTDGEETCGGDPCALAKSLREKGPRLIIHVIGYRAKDSTEGAGYLQARCLADLTGGFYVQVSTTDELISALNKSLAWNITGFVWKIENIGGFAHGRSQRCSPRRH
jgi:Ca-activated chloride channel homolog